MVFPGMIGRILYNGFFFSLIQIILIFEQKTYFILIEQVGCSDPDECKSICMSSSGCSNIAYPKLVITLMPAGARGY